jgi:hypothetical protein
MAYSKKKLDFDYKGNDAYQGLPEQGKAKVGDLLFRQLG